VSLILVLASAVQIGVWLVGTRLPPPTRLRPSCVTAHGILFDMVQEAVSRRTGESGVDQPVLFIGCLVVSLLSGIAWYGAARLAVGPAWGLWTGLCWVAHPGFAFLAPRPSKLALLIALIPTVWWILLWWKRSRRRVTAVLLGLTLALFSLVSIQVVLILPGLMLAMLLAPAKGGKRWPHVAWTLAGFALLLAASLVLVVPRLTQKVDGANQYKMQQQLAVHLWQAFDDDDGSPVARAARLEHRLRPRENRLSPWRFLAFELWRSPPTVARWFGARMGRTLYDTADGKLRRPLLALQLLWLVPALWGYLVALRHAPWRWAAITAGLFVAVAWLFAALAEPRARNLTAVGGFGILFALVGVADLYERVFGRRLTGTASREGASCPPRDERGCRARRKGHGRGSAL